MCPYTLPCSRGGRPLRTRWRATLQGWGGGATPSSAASEATSSVFGRGSVHGSAGHLGPVPEGARALVMLLAVIQCLCCPLMASYAT